jgi:cytochrome c-type biogenesis protein CcmH/NrfG
MDNAPATAFTASPTLRATQVYTMAAICLLAGLAVGYLFHGPQSPLSPTPPIANTVPPPVPATTTGAGHPPSLDAMRQMADKQASPLLQKLKSDPNSVALLVQVGAIYHSTHQFKEAAAYYDRAVKIDPRNVPNRVKLAASLYRSDDVDGAIAQLNTALSYDPKDANSLFNLGIIKWQGKRDGKGALAAWQELLKSNPQLSADRKAAVLKQIADVLTAQGDQHGIEGTRNHDGHTPSPN